jgi:hypothetical protein
VNALVEIAADQAFPTERCQTDEGLAVQDLCGLGTGGDALTLVTSHPLVS